MVLGILDQVTNLTGYKKVIYISTDEGLHGMEAQQAHFNFHKVLTLFIYQLSHFIYQLSIFIYQLSIFIYQLSISIYQLSIFTYQLSIFIYTIQYDLLVNPHKGFITNLQARVLI